MNFLVDAQLPPALAKWISSRGHQASHVVDVGLHAAPDSVVWEHASRTNAVLITKDEDFFLKWLLSEPRVPLLWIRKGNCSNQALMVWFEPLWTETLKRLAQGEQLIELRG